MYNDAVMMKTAYTLIGLALIGYAGVAAAQQPYYPATGQTTYVRYVPDEAPVWAVELAGNANFAMKDIMDGEWGESTQVHTYGADVTLVRKLSQHFSCNLRLGYSYGSDSCGGDFEVNNYSLMPGVRFTIPLEEDTGMHEQLYPSVFAGINVGVLSRGLKYENHFDVSSHDSAFGLGYSAEIGIRVPIADRFEVIAAYQVSGSTSQPSIRYGETTESVSAHYQYYNTARLGFSYTF